jgi:adenosylhomocysteine nucleosidase
MDKIGIIVAMTSERDMLLREMEDVREVEQNARTFYVGHIGNLEVVAMQCGIGKVNAAVGALTMIEAFAPEAIINTGIAGGTGRGAEVLDVVAGVEVGYHDVWCGPGNAPGQIQGLPERFPGAVWLFDIDGMAAAGDLKTGIIASGDRFVSTPEELAAVLTTQPEAIAVDMESGAIAQVCYMKQVPFLAIRVVSDTPGVENHLQQYCDFWSVAPERTFGVLKHLLKTVK